MAAPAYVREGIFYVCEVEIGVVIKVVGGFFCVCDFFKVSCALHGE